jgi:hypothetical protein
MHYLLAPSVNAAIAITRNLGWSRVPHEKAMLPVFLTPKGKTVQYATCEGLRGRDMKDVTIFLVYGWERNCLHRTDVLDWAKSRGATLHELYEDDEVLA